MRLSSTELQLSWLSMLEDLMSYVVVSYVNMLILVCTFFVVFAMLEKIHPCPLACTDMRFRLYI